jgi:hypothetical protein
VRAWFKHRGSEIVYYLGNMPQAADWEPVSDARMGYNFSPEEAYETMRDWLLRHGHTREELDETVGDRWGPKDPTVRVTIQPLIPPSDLGVFRRFEEAIADKIRQAFGLKRL